MQADKDSAYRLALAAGFLTEARQDIELKRWRSCVNNSQLCVENAGKLALSLFGVVPKTHDPARQLMLVLHERALPSDVINILNQMMPDLEALGSREHILTDYGDEETYTLPWDIFSKETATNAFNIAQRVLKLAQELYESAKIN